MMNPCLSHVMWLPWNVNCSWQAKRNPRLLTASHTNNPGSKFSSGFLKNWRLWNCCIAPSNLKQICSCLVDRFDSTVPKPPKLSLSFHCFGGDLYRYELNVRLLARAPASWHAQASKVHRCTDGSLPGLPQVSPRSLLLLRTGCFQLALLHVAQGEGSHLEIQIVEPEIAFLNDLNATGCCYRRCSGLSACTRLTAASALLNFWWK